MTIEEKAKRYDEAIERANELNYISDKDSLQRKTIEHIFPELKESEDERIRKDIISYLKSSTAISPKTWIAWLEKQGEQKPVSKPKFKVGDLVKYTNHNKQPIYKVNYIDKECYICTSDDTTLGDKVVMHFAFDNPYLRLVEQTQADKAEPKFKIGDYVVGKYISGYISEVRDDCYLLDYQGFPIDKQDDYHLWTIEDAKDGDVLASNCSIFIFSQEYIAGKPKAHCGIMNGLFLVKPKGCWTNEKCYPATKEQHDLLFQKMEKAGYVWDVGKKELKKIEQKSTDNQFTPEQANILDKHIDKFLEQKSAWSEEDEEMHRKCICAMRTSACGFPEEEKFVEQVNNWLKSLKDRVQPKQEWSEEDETKIKSIIAFLKSPSLCAMEGNKGIIDENIKYLKSLKDRVQPQKQEWSDEDYNKIETIACHLENTDNEVTAKVLRNIRDKYCHIIPQNTWKPSDEQMDVIEAVINNRSFQRRHLDSLYADLKKLKS